MNNCTWPLSLALFFISLIEIDINFDNNRLFTDETYMDRLSSPHCSEVITETVVIADSPRFFGEVQGFLVTGLRELHIPVRHISREIAFGIRLNVDPVTDAPCRNESIVCFWTAPCAKSPPFDGTYTWDIPTKSVLVNL
jgi:hypothetical protein